MNLIDDYNGRRERLWLSPECHSLHQQTLDFGEPA